MSIIDNKLKRIFDYTLSVSNVRTDGNNFSEFSIYVSKIIENINKEFKSADNFHELNLIFDIILSIWDDYFMSNSNVPTKYNNNFSYDSKPNEYSTFESIIREIISNLMNNIDEFVSYMSRRSLNEYGSFSNKWDLYRKHRKLICDVLKIGLELPLEEMFDITQSRSDLPIHLHVLHNVDKFIQIYLWTVLNILNKGEHLYDFEKIENMNIGLRFMI